MKIRDFTFAIAVLILAGVTGKALGQTNPALGESASTVNFPMPVVVTQVASTLQAVTLTNTGGGPLPLAITVSGDFTIQNGCQSPLAGGRSCVVQVGFAPSQPGVRAGVLSIATGAGYSSTTVALSGTGLAILPANTGALSLWQTLLGEPVVVWYKVQQPIASLTAASNSSLFGVAIVAETGSGHGTLPAEDFTQSMTANCNNCWLGVQFFSQTAGTVNAALTLTSNAGGNAYMVGLTGTALPVVGLLLSPAVQDFGTVAVNSSSVGTTFTLTNMLADVDAVTVTSVAVTGDFVVLANTTGGAACGGTLAVTASCFVQVGFEPTGTGERAGTLTIVTSGGTAAATFTGLAVADPGLAIDPNALNFANVPGASATRQMVTLRNTGAASLDVGAVSSSDPSFSVGSTCGTLAAGASCSLSVGFAPQSATVAASLSIPVTAGQTTTVYTVALNGLYTAQGAGLEIVAGDANFGAAATGAMGVTREFTLNNLTAKALNVRFAIPREFPMASADMCGTLAAEGSCTFSVSFLPVTGGALTGTVTAVGTPADGSANVEGLAYMLGYGAAQGSLAVTGNTIPNTPLQFGQVSSGQSAQQVLTLTNNGKGLLTIHRMTIEPPFYSTTTCGSGLAEGASCQVTLTYAPVDEVAGMTASPRTDTGTLEVESDAASSTDELEMTGSVIPVMSNDPSNPATLNDLELSEGALTFENTQVGSASAEQTVVLTNAGTTAVHVTSVTVSAGFMQSSTCTTLQPTATCSVAVEFGPTTAASASVRTGLVAIASDAGTSLEFVSLLGVSTPAPLTLSPAALDFGTVNVGASDALTVMVTNVTAVPVTLLGLAASGDYAVAAGTCPATGATLAAGASCVLTVTFKPTATGTRVGVLSLSNDATVLPLTVSLTGDAVEAQLTVTPGALAFGDIDVGSPATLTLALLNTGSASVTGISNVVSGADAGDFAVSVPCSVTMLAPNQGCSETVRFMPAAVGSRMATLTVASSDPQGPAVIALSGTGVQAGAFVLTVNGASAATVTVASGAPGTYALLLTPQGGFTGAVALTCSPVTAGEYASCSLLASTLTLGATPQSSTATINTITAEAGAVGVVLAGLLVMPFGVLRRVRRRKGFVVMGIAMVLCAGMPGCGGGGGDVAKNLLTTPAGTYQYKVTASATSGVAVSSSVMLTLVVQ